MRTLPLTILLGLLAVSLFLNVCQFVSQEEVEANDTVRTTFVDTIPYYHPVPKDCLVITYITDTLSVAPQEESVAPSNGSVQSSEPAARDSAAVRIPITQKVYEDSTYTAYVSGYKPSLDSLELHIPHSVMTITNTVRTKQSRWSIGLQVGYGIGLSPTLKYSPYIGIGVQYAVFKF